jgi:hypothetical protein
MWSEAAKTRHPLIQTFTCRKLSLYCSLCSKYISLIETHHQLSLNINSGIQLILNMFFVFWIWLRTRCLNAVGWQYIKTAPFWSGYEEGIYSWFMELNHRLNRLVVRYDCAENAIVNCYIDYRYQLWIIDSGNKTCWSVGLVLRK